MNYGQILKSLREEKDLKQIDVADYLEIDHSQYCHYELEDRIIPIKHLNSLSNYFNVSIDYLFNFTQVKQYSNLRDINKTLSSTRLKEFRKDNKLTQDKLAKVLNISRTTITEYERGTNIIATPILYDLCKKYKISADYLLGKIDEPLYLNKI